MFRPDGSGNGGVIIDSGTSVTRLVQSVYKSMRDAFRAGTKRLFDNVYSRFIQFLKIQVFDQRVKKMAGKTLWCKMVVAIVVMVAVMVTSWGGAAEGSVTCQDVVIAMAPCAAYLMGNAQTPAPACYTVVQSLKSRLSVVADHQTAYNCFKQAATSYGISVPKAQALPRLCKVSLNVIVAYENTCHTKKILPHKNTCDTESNT